ncbi:MAG: ACP S-malonyltransferase [Caulobacteraceae bacterium]
MNNIALVFPGQGSQFVGMARTLYDEYSYTRQIFEEANSVLGFDLRKICFEGSTIELNKIENVFVAILTASVAAFRVYMNEIGIEPAFVAGHSLGEYSALVCSEVISFSDALRLVRQRSVYAGIEAEFGTMTVVNGIYKNIVESECQKASQEGQEVTIGCYNSDDQVVISGSKQAVIRVEDKVAEMGAQITPLLISPPFHSPLMNNAANKLKKEFTKYQFRPARWPIIQNVTALPSTDPETIIRNLVLQMTQPVQWKATLDFMEDHYIEKIIEIGPQAILANLTQINNKNMIAMSFGQKNDRQVILEQLKPELKDKDNEAKRKVQRSTVITKCLANAVCTRNNNWDNEEYRKGVEEPYEKIEKMQQELEEKDQEPTFEQMREALEMLCSVFHTKKVPVEERIRRITRILNDTGTQNDFSYILEELQR